jgi:hypothetical protein
MSDDRIELQNKEFAAMNELAKQWRRLQMTPPVDDDYERVRFEYDQARRSFNDAQTANDQWRVPELKTGIVQDWAANLGLRHQGVLVSAVRGCDNVPRDDASKYIVRVYRGILLKSHCGDIKKAASFMIPFEPKWWDSYKMEFLSSIDHYPNHWILHFMHACEIVGYKHSDGPVRVAFHQLYKRLVSKFHLYPETEMQLDYRLDADESSFAKAQN